MTNSADQDQLASLKPTDLDLHCLQMQGISGFSRTNLFACWVILHAFLSSGDFFFKINFFKKKKKKTIRVSNSLVPDQARCFVGPDLGLNCLQRLSADDKSCH